ncbi:MAG: hypothetical protein AMS27_03130 [Bacteroides sp. SM23_62_1]|nr:MAG: hypothetical protein AMS27_03130 [Bacteroides sp. SM23_62_1]
MIYFDFKKIPFLRILLPLLIGVLIQKKADVDLHIILPGMIMLFLFIVLYQKYWKRKGYRRESIFGIPVSMLLLLGGMALLKDNTIAGEPERIRLGTVALIPVEKGKTYKLILDRLWERRPSGWCPQDGRIILYIEKSIRLDHVEPGDRLVFNCPLKQIDLPANPMEFDYRRYCEIHGVYWIGYLDNKNWKQLKGNAKIQTVFIPERIRMKLLKFIDGYNLQNSELATSLLLGYRENLEEQQKLEFTASGAMHILAVSGLHVGIIYGILMFIFKPCFRKKPESSFFIITPCIWTYAFLTGLTPSVTRASLMLSLYMVSRIMKRKSSLIHIVFFSAFLMILINPHIVFRVSFQLSFMAITGISVLFQDLYAFLKTGNWLINKVIGLTCISFSAQLFTVPLSLYYFHQFPHYFLFTNLLVIPLAAMILYSGCMFFLFSFLPPVSSFFAVILDILTGALQSITKLISSLPYSSTANIGVDIFDIILLYIILISLIVFFHKKSAPAMFIALLITATIVGKFCYEKILQQKQNKVLICSIEGTTVLNFIDGDLNFVATDDTSWINRERINYHIKPYWIHSGLKEPVFISLSGYSTGPVDQSGTIRTWARQEDLIFIQFFNTRIGVLSHHPLFNGHNHRPLKLDLLLINSSGYVDLSEVILYIQPERIIIDRRVPYWLSAKLESQCDKLNIPYHTVLSAGCYLMEE